VLIFTAALLLWGAGSFGSCFAQSSPPQVVTVDTGVQYEGDVFSVKELSINKPTPSPIMNASDAIGIDNGIRRVFINANTARPPFGDSDLAREKVFEIYQKAPKWTEGTGTFIGVGPFDQFGHREFTIGLSAKGGTAVRKTYIQGITKIGPRFCELKNLAGNDTLEGTKQWTMRISTGSVPREVIRSVLHSRIKEPDQPDEYFDIAYLFQQMGDFKMASEELRQIESNPKFANDKDQIRDSRDQLGQLMARQILREIELRKSSGQFDVAIQMAKFTNKDRLAGDIKAEFADIEEQERLVREGLDEKRTKVFNLIDKIKLIDDKQIGIVQSFKEELESDLNRFNAPRLDSFLRFANDAGTLDERKLGIAISGWLLGSNRPPVDLSVAIPMFTVRGLIREYLNLETPVARREAILKEIAAFETGAPQYIDWLIQQMKPIDSSPEIESYTGEKPIKFTVEFPGTLAAPEPKKYQCLAHLPPQYNPYRKYPLLLCLPGGTQTVEENLLTWSGKYNENLQMRYGQAMRNGYIVVSVDWRDPGQLRWGYTGREHRIVMDALYFAMRKFSINSDRVFIAGHRDGADGAYDIGLSHPEHWAGVIGYSGTFRKYIDKYWDNQHVRLPLYCVNGTKDYTTLRTMMYSLNKWIRSKKHVVPTVVHYRGRGNELFMEDFPEAFKWMRGQTRRWPDRQSGFQFSCSALRPWDTYFWFYEMNGLPRDRTVLPELFERTASFKNMLEIGGEIIKPNEFKLQPISLKINTDSTLWLSPQFVDFEKQIVIRGRGKFKDSVKQSRRVVLEDYLRRADREHIYHARIDCRNGEWTAQKDD
jgi:pimeloyl-ACP methyl ester carboxylesterase